MLTIFLYLLVGYALYRARWPEGFLPVARDAERERTRRVGRRRVAPLHGTDGDEP